MGLGFSPVSAGDLEALADLRVEAMRESLERIGRFDPLRARERLRKSFTPSATEWIEWDGRRVGFLALREEANRYVLDHLYLLPAEQGKGIGTAVMRLLQARAIAAGKPIDVGALRGSASNRFYLKHRFRCTSEEAWDLHYRWDLTTLS